MIIINLSLNHYKGHQSEELLCWKHYFAQLLWFQWYE